MIAKRMVKIGAGSVRLTLADGTERILTLGAGRGATTRLQRIIDSLDWTRAELLGTGGATVDVMMRESDPEESDTAGTDDPVARQVAIISSETRRHAELLRSMMQDALQAQRDTIAMLSTLTQQLAATHSEAVAAVRDAALAEAAAEAAQKPAEPDPTAQLVSQVIAGALSAPAPKRDGQA